MSPFRSFIATIVFLLGGIILIHINGLPGDFDQPTGRLNAWIFAWCAAFYMPHRARIYNIWLVMIAVYYALYLDEGLAMGALMLLGLGFIIHYFKDVIVQQHFVATLVSVTGIYFLLNLARNAILAILFLPTVAFPDLLWRAIIFAVGFGVFSLIANGLLKKTRDV